MVALKDYAKIKNNYCICYFGYADEYLVQLRLILPALKRSFPGLNIFLGCKDDKIHILSGCPDVLKISELKVRKKDFAHVREVKYNGKIHPIEDLLSEAEISQISITKKSNIQTTKAVILTEGVFPTRNLTSTEINSLKKMAKDQKCHDIEINGNIENAGMVMGVECVGLYEAAAKGIHTTLVPTGIGTRLYKMMFPNSIIVA